MSYGHKSLSQVMVTWPGQKISSTFLIRGRDEDIFTGIGTGTVIITATVTSTPISEQ